MIRINLLPEEHRRRARTPLRLVATLAAAAVLNAGLGVWWAWTALGVQTEIEGQAGALQVELDGLGPQVAYHKALDGEARHYRAREEILAAITASRISWTKKLDELVDVVNRGGNGDRHLVWLDDVQVTQSVDPKAKSPGSLRASGHSGSDKFAHVANFLDDLKASPFISDFEPPAPPEGTQAQVDDKLVPSVAWSFPLSLTLKPTELRRSGAAAAAAAPRGGRPQPGAKPEGGSGQEAGQ